MPKGTDWVHFTYINLAYVALIVQVYLSTYMVAIKQDWPKYRCNPMYMPLSDNLTQDFTYCIQNMQTNFMGYLLEPLTYITSNLGQLGAQFTDSMNFFRVMVSNIRTFLSSLTEGLYGVFLNAITEFRRITIGITDLVGKLIGVVATFLYVIDGTMKTMQSAWKGPPGQMVQALCFHPDTQVKLETGETTAMKNLNLGDVIEGGARVQGLIRLANVAPAAELYVIANGVNETDIYVTGRHLIFSPENKKYIEVKDSPVARRQSQVQSDELFCLITSNHTIRLGAHTFHDWDDDDVRFFKVFYHG
jgi:hypothetical protein